MKGEKEHRKIRDPICTTSCRISDIRYLPHVRLTAAVVLGDEVSADFLVLDVCVPWLDRTLDQVDQIHMMSSRTCSIGAYYSSFGE